MIFNFISNSLIKPYTGENDDIGNFGSVQLKDCRQQCIHGGFVFFRSFFLSFKVTRIYAMFIFLRELEITQLLTGH